MTSNSRLKTSALFAGLFSLVALLASAARGQTAAPATPAAPTPSAFASSLALRTDRIVADSSRVAMGWLAQTSPVAFTSKGALRLEVALAPWEPEAKGLKKLGNFTIFGGDLAKNPFPFTVDVSGSADGYYRYVAEVFDGETSVAKLEAPVVLLAGLESKQAAFEVRLAKIAGHDSVKASVLYPFDLARVINLRKRVFGSANQNPEFGLSQAGVQQPFDFAGGLKKSAELLAALEAGQDPLQKAGGDHVRHYRMAEADEILPYRVFVPSTWDGKSALPLVLVLHGNSRDYNFYFDRDGGIIPATAEKHGFMLVAPLGYAPNAGYNYVPFDRERGVRGLASASSASQTFGAGATGGVNGSTTPALLRSEWSEQDAMHVFDLVKKEYPVDPKRTFLFGYSAGGQGGHYIGQKYAENWAAIAIGGSGATLGAHYNVEKIKNIPIMVFAGTDDPVLKATRTMGEALQQKGVPAVFKEIVGATHDTAPSKAIADVFDFFAAHGR
jgi:poly(3-hydroxybutyrate) depolymerase